MKVFIETSIFIRFLVRDNDKKLAECVSLFNLIEEGKLIPYISNTVISEILFVLTKIYKISKFSALGDIEKIFNFRNITVIEKTNTPGSLSLFKKYSIKYGDCLIATQVPKGVAIVTYDTDFSKIPSVKSIPPAEIFNSDSVN
ncbi:MAG: type II toxin-antitoxin system VapC family toxin [Patescibacteria group bacterium]